MGIIMRGRKCYTGKIQDKSQYSTTEQFTGKYWIDGKPIYSRTFYITTKGSWVDTGVSGISRIISKSANFKLTNMLISEYNVSQNDYATAGAYMANANLMVGVFMSGALVDAYITIEYTKS